MKLVKTMVLPCRGIFVLVSLFAMACGSAFADVRDVVYGYNETNIFAVNIQTGAATNVFHFGTALTGDAAMAQRPSDGVLFYIDGQSGNDTVFSWDPSNPATPPVNLGRTGAGRSVSAAPGVCGGWQSLRH